MNVLFQASVAKLNIFGIGPGGELLQDVRHQSNRRVVQPNAYKWNER
jgi:hypothetical protein